MIKEVILTLLIPHTFCYKASDVLPIHLTRVYVWLMIPTWCLCFTMPSCHSLNFFNMFSLCFSKGPVSLKPWKIWIARCFRIFWKDRFIKLIMMPNYKESQGRNDSRPLSACSDTLIAKRYLIQQRLGRGSFGTVYLVLDKKAKEEEKL